MAPHQFDGDLRGNALQSRCFGVGVLGQSDRVLHLVGRALRRLDPTTRFPGRIEDAERWA